ncbi:DnaD domain protein [Oceanobacillus chungangensis]|uniref:DnaB/C C-terminal domain-containing protein n=1 Tax=Oceanobacillus chungangensis TaxID=1229152 RepID=A0A3D8PUJ7_9BACI|nr:DnaD domain protein [Oceanobacillus chungangensis]RDW19674.1 hypothetical protein CWR45_06235 [Oceanobacillus chungangensis]
MTTFNFHRDKNFLMDWLMLNHLTTGEIVLWHTLMNIGNRLGQKSVFNAPNSTLMKFTGLSKQGIINARKKLLERGFIRYEKGHQNKAPVYEMIPLPQAIGQYFSTTKNQELTRDLTGEMAQDVTQDFTLHLTSYSTQELPIHKDKSKEERRGGGSERDMNPLFKIYEENINKLTPLIREALIEWTKTTGIEIVKEAIAITVKKGGRTYSYTEKILKEWQHAGLQTIEAVQSYELEKELEKDNKLIPFRKPDSKEKEDIFAELLKEEF